MRKIKKVLAAVLLTALCITGCGNSGADNTANNTTKNDGNAANDVAGQETSGEETTESVETLTGKHNVKIKIKDYGTISVELDADVAPITVTNFVKLVKEGFYDGLTFHRIISGFMIQGGDPLGNGTGGSEQTIKGEFAANGVENGLSHTRGTISMARSQDYNSASSQFFIMHEDNAGLDGQYAAFGTVTEGIEIVDKICEDTQVEDNNGTVLAENQPKIESIKVVE